MPKLWNETIEAHRRTVHEAVLDATAALVTANGLTSVTMSQIAASSGIGRATLYKYFPDVDAILIAWHERQVTSHLEHLATLADEPGTPSERLQAVLEGYALISYRREHHGGDLAAVLHRGEHITRAHQRLNDLVRDLITEAIETGAVRDDIAPAELACYCLHALTAAASLTSEAAIRRLVTLTMNGISPPGC